MSGPELLRDYDPETHGEVLYVPGQAEGAVPNGTRVRKVRSEPGDTFEDGVEGVILASHMISGEFGYFVAFDEYPEVPCFIVGHRLMAVAELPEGFGREVR